MKTSEIEKILKETFPKLTVNFKIDVWFHYGQCTETTLRITIMNDTRMVEGFDCTSLNDGIRQVKTFLKRKNKKKIDVSVEC